MFEYIVRRVLSFIPMLLVMPFLIFLGLELTPGDAVSFMVSPDAMANMDQAQLAAMRESLGLNDPFLMRYIRWLGNVLRGDFGYTALALRQPITLVFLAAAAAMLAHAARAALPAPRAPRS